MPATPPSVEIRLTPAQLKALMFLPADGRWAPRPFGIGLNLLNQIGLVEIQGPVHRRWFFRLTPAGIAERKKREGAG